MQEEKLEEASNTANKTKLHSLWRKIPLRDTVIREAIEDDIRRESYLRLLCSLAFIRPTHRLNALPLTTCICIGEQKDLDRYSMA